MLLIILKLYKHVHNILLEGTVSQISFIKGLISIFILKNGKI